MTCFIVETYFEVGVTMRAYVKANQNINKWHTIITTIPSFVKIIIVNNTFKKNDIQSRSIANVVVNLGFYG